MSTETIERLRRERDEARGERDMLLTRFGAGASSDGMMRAAIAGHGVGHTFFRPLDAGDYGRCEATRAVAPPHLHEAMDAMLADYRRDLDAKADALAAREGRHSHGAGHALCNQIDYLLGDDGEIDGVDEDSTLAALHAAGWALVKVPLDHRTGQEEGPDA